MYPPPSVITMLCMWLLHFPERTPVSWDRTALRCVCHDLRALSFVWSDGNQPTRGCKRSKSTIAASALDLTDRMHCYFWPLRSEQTSQNWGRVPRAPWMSVLWRRGVLGARRGVAVAVRGAHQRLEEREEAGAGQVPGSRVTWRSSGKENVTLFERKCLKFTSLFFFCSPVSSSYLS